VGSPRPRHLSRRGGRPGTMRIAFVHDWLTGMRGGEKVLDVLCERFPDAELFTLVHTRGSVSPAIERLQPHTSFLQRLPFVAKYYRQCLPLFPTAIEQFSFDGFDLVVSVSHCCAKSIVRPGRVPHVCYCLTPMRYAWDQFNAYFGPERLGTVGSRLMRPVMARMARWDRETANRADRYVAISHYVAGRIRRYYNREAIVVYPPVDTEFFHPDDTVATRQALVVSALVPYKRIDVAIDACRLAGIPLSIVGEGPDRARLERAAGPDVRFLGSVSNDTIRDLYRRSAVTLLPGEEDFGIAPLEAQACGRPVVALGRGGAVETVVPDVSGALVDDLDPRAFADAITATIDRRFDAAAIRAHAERFSRARFADEMSLLIQDSCPDAASGAEGHA
ncbi:MAG TPA: glycosyltransferase, partial [Vicinamibacterales bacterium]|nr:glycosyltransferase [Vicinamibacterales bacterium]